MAVENPSRSGLWHALQFAAVYFPPLVRVLDVTPLRAEDWVVIVPAAIVPVIGQLIAAMRNRTGLYG